MKCGFQYCMNERKDSSLFCEDCERRLPKFVKPIPKLHDEIYVPSQFYIGHGEDDVVGGLAQVIEIKPGVSGGEPSVFIRTLEHPGDSYNWQFLAAKQDDLAKRFGNRRAYPDPEC